MWKNKLGSNDTSEVPQNLLKENTDISPVSWQHYFDTADDIAIPNKNCVFRVYQSGKDVSGNIFVFLHGGGHSAMSWALTTALLRDQCRVLAFDSRGHGSTVTENDDDLSADTQSNDVVDLLLTMHPDAGIILVGHSMGGAIAARAAASGKIKKLIGLVVIDVVEGTALLALSHMHSVLENRPTHFESLESAIQWSVNSGTLRNIESARISIPSQLVESSGKFIWKTNLFKSETYWNGWFTNLSTIFLSAKVPKLLILAGTDRLDKDLTIGQMQGKFQLVLLPACGHVIQEDDPKKTADALIQFKTRFKF